MSHDLQIELDVAADGRIDEILEFDGLITISRGAPFSVKGFRQIEFTVLEWQAVAFSRVLNTQITYRSSPVVQPVSFITAQQQKSDFPAHFKFNVIFDAIVDGTVVFSEHHGMPEGDGFHTVPPDGNSPAMTQFETELILFEHPILGLVQLRPLSCNDRSSTTITVFSDGFESGDTSAWS